MKAQLKELREAQRRLEGQLQAHEWRQPPNDAAEQLAAALTRLVPRMEVPNNPGPYEGGQDFPKWRRYLLRCAQVNRWSRTELVERLPPSQNCRARLCGCLSMLKHEMFV